MDAETAQVHRDEPGRVRPARLTRSRHHKVVAGVAGGLGDYFGVDPVVFRIGFVAVTLLGGSGILLYLIGWLVIPKEGHRRSVAQHALSRGISGPAVGMTLLVLASVILVHDNFRWGVGRFTLSLLLLGAGAALLWNLPGAGTNEEDDDDVEPPPPPPPTPRRRPARRRSPLGRGTVAAVLVVVGAIGLADASDAVEIDPEVYLAAALLIVGIGLVVGAWWGRSRSLIAFGALIAVALAGMSAIDVPLRGGFGDRRHAPDNFGDLQREIRLFAGEMDIDLTRLDFRQRVTDIEASVGFGELTVDIPHNVRVIIDAETDWVGDISVLGADDEGVHADVQRSVGPRGQGLVRLHLEVGAGQIRVR